MLRRVPVSARTYFCPVEVVQRRRMADYGGIVEKRQVGVCGSAVGDGGAAFLRGVRGGGLIEGARVVVWSSLLEQSLSSADEKGNFIYHVLESNEGFGIYTCRTSARILRSARCNRFSTLQSIK